MLAETRKASGHALSSTMMNLTSSGDRRIGSVAIPTSCSDSSIRPTPINASPPARRLGELPL